MERHEDAVFTLSKLNLNNIEKTIHEAYHQEGPGRPPRNPLGIFKALMTKRLRQIPSDRELYRRLWNDPTLRMICDIEEREKPYHPSQLTRFRTCVGPRARASHDRDGNSDILHYYDPVRAFSRMDQEKNRRFISKEVQGFYFQLSILTMK